MAYRDLGNIDEKLIQEVIRMGAENGVENVSSKRLAVRCQISNGTIFHRFATMRTLLDAAAQWFDRLHMADVLTMAAENCTAGQIWDRMMDSFLDDPDGTLYYVSYTNAFGFDPTVENPRSEEFLRIARGFFHAARPLADNQYLILWDYVTSMAFYYAEKFIHRLLPYDADTKAFVKRLVFEGIAGVLAE